MVQNKSIGKFSFSYLLIGHHLDSTFTGTNRNGPNNLIGPKRD